MEEIKQQLAYLNLEELNQILFWIKQRKELLEERARLVAKLHTKEG